VPVRIEDVPAGQVPGILRPLVYRDLFDLPEEAALRVLLEVARGPGRPARPPRSPGRARRDGLVAWATLGRGCRGPCPECETCRRAMLPSPAGTCC
jgi:hypothetical protein